MLPALAGQGLALASGFVQANTAAARASGGTVTIDTPVLVLAGEHDEKFTSIGQRLAAELPQGQFRSVPGAGHATHLEGPNRTATLVTSWLNS